MPQIMPHPNKMLYPESNIRFVRNEMRTEKYENELFHKITVAGIPKEEPNYFHFDDNKHTFAKILVEIADILLPLFGAKTISQDNLSTCLRHALAKFKNNAIFTPDELYEALATIKSINSSEKFGPYLNSYKGRNDKKRIEELETIVNKKLNNPTQSEEKLILQTHASQRNQRSEQVSNREIVTLDFPNGERYTGQLKDRKPHGIGIYHFKDYSRYEGSFYEGKIEGQGKIIDPENREFNAKFVSSKINGKLITDSAQQRLNGVNGEFIDRKFTGNGIVLVNGQAKFDGNFEKGLPHGNCTLYFDKERILKFTGMFKNGTPEGAGILIHKGHHIFKGNVQDGVIPKSEITRVGAVAIEEFKYDIDLKEFL